jgi:hypothetical protein
VLPNERLTVLTTLLDDTVKLAKIAEQDSTHQNVEPQDEKHFSTADVAGLGLLTRCILSALEHAFSQCTSHNNANDETAKAQTEPF